MRKIHAFLAVAGIALAGSIASARPNPYAGINDLVTAPYWYSDYFGSQLTINGVDRSNGTSSNEPLSSLHIVDTNFQSGPHFTNRHQAALGTNGVPFLFQPGAGNDFRMDFDVTITTPVPSGTSAHVEAGLWFGTAPSFPSSAGADIGQFVLLPSNGAGEIAAFGGTLPYTSSTNTGGGAGYQPQLGLASYSSTIHMSMVYYGTDNLVTYGINGISTDAFGISNQGNPGFAPNSMLGVYVQGPNVFGNASGAVDVTFSNVSISVPGPGSAALLGLGGLVAIRRRR